MTTGLGIVIMLTSLCGLIAWGLAIHTSVCIVRIRFPGAPRRQVMTSTVTGLFLSEAQPAEIAPLVARLRMRRLIALGCFIAGGALSFLLPLGAQQ